MNQIWAVISEFLLDVLWLVAPLVFIGVCLVAIFKLFTHIRRMRWLRQEANPENTVMLELIPPANITRSPAAMEMVFNALHIGGGAGTWVKKYIEGKQVKSFSFEILSDGGQIRFFVWMTRKWQPILESQLYAQFPQIELREVEDYARKMPLYDPDGEWECTGLDYTLTKPDPYPIATYIDYGLDTALGGLEEDQKIDPLVSLIEYIATAVPGEQFWYQIIFRKHTPGLKNATLFRIKPVQDMQSKTKDLIKKIIADFHEENGYSEEQEVSMAKLTDLQKQVVNAVQRSLTKNVFDVNIRMMHWAKKEVFRPATVIPAMIGVFHPFSTDHLNGLRIIGSTFPDTDYPWEDPTGQRTVNRKSAMQMRYLWREGFYVHDALPPILLTSEELATLYHFPGKILQAAGVEKVEVRKAEPPANLPR